MFGKKYEQMSSTNGTTGHVMEATQQNQEGCEQLPLLAGSQTQDQGREAKVSSEFHEDSNTQDCVNVNDEPQIIVLQDHDTLELHHENPPPLIGGVGQAARAHPPRNEDGAGAARQGVHHGPGQGMIYPDGGKDGQTNIKVMGHSDENNKVADDSTNKSNQIYIWVPFPKKTGESNMQYFDRTWWMWLASYAGVLLFTSLLLGFLLADPKLTVTLFMLGLFQLIPTSGVLLFVYGMEKK
ncbi:unnamed protein product [Amoebophrya sp. A25]|nr:unnamed protein product [Amoebophrya sp. A25]|eukprot:GSA25T00014153001.1